MDERRRSLRRDVAGDLAILANSMNVRLLDISTGGVMLTTSRSVDLGTKGRLRLNLGGESLTADVQIQRVQAEPGVADQYVIGAMFVALTPEERQLIERFTAHQ